MKFYDNKKEEDKIIENIQIHGYWYEIKYLNDDYTIFKNITNDKLEKDKLVMLKQAIKRDSELYRKYKLLLTRDISVFLLTSLSFAFSTNGTNQLLACLLFIISLLYGKILTDNLEKFLELKKYHTFLEIREDLEKKENKDILNIIESDKYYQDPRGIVIDNLDDYSTSDLEVIKKEIKRRKCTI